MSHFCTFDLLFVIDFVVSYGLFLPLKILIVKLVKNHCMIFHGKRLITSYHLLNPTEKLAKTDSVKIVEEHHKLKVIQKGMVIQLI